MVVFYTIYAFIFALKNYWHSTLTKNDIEAYLACIGRFYNRLRHFINAWSVFSIRRKDVFIILLGFFFIIVFANASALFAIFVLVTFDAVCLSSVRFKHIDCSYHFLELNYRGLNLNFLKLVQLLIDGDIEFNPGPTQNDSKAPCGRPRKKYLKKTPKMLILMKALMLILLVIQKHNMFFQYN